MEDFLKNIEDFRNKHKDFFDKPLSEKRAILETNGRYLFTIKSNDKYNSPRMVFKLFDFWVIEHQSPMKREFYFTNISPEFKYNKKKRNIKIFQYSSLFVLFVILPLLDHYKVFSNLYFLLNDSSIFKDFGITFLIICKILYIICFINIYFVLVVFIIFGTPMFLIDKIKDIMKKNRNRQGL